MGTNLAAWIGRQFGTAPPAPAANESALYFKSDGKLYTKNSNNVETALSTGSRWGVTTVWPFASNNTNIPVTYSDGDGARLGDLIISTNGLSQGDVFRVTAVINSSTVSVEGITNLRGPTGPTGGPLADTGWIALSLLNGSVPYPGWEPPGYRKVGNMVFLRGLLNNGTMTSGTVIANLPAGFRPASDSHVNALSNNVLITLNILANGDIKYNATSQSGGWTSLANLTLVVDTPATGIVPAVSGWIKPSYGSGYADWGDSSNELVRYQKVGTQVSLRGLFQRSSGSGSIMMFLPQGYRPSRNTWRPLGVNGLWNQAGIYINNVGEVTLSAGSFSNGNYLIVDAQFDTDQP